MQRFSFFLLLLLFCISAYAQANRDPNAAKLVTSDIDLFWKAYDKATPTTDLYVYRDEYLKMGSPGLKMFDQLRINGSCNLAEAINNAPRYYKALREPSSKVASYEPKIRASFRKLQELYPDSVFPDVYFLIGRMSSGGTLTDKALLIGVDMYGKNGDAPIDELGNWHKSVVGSIDRLPVIVAHELIHYQQKYSRPNGSSLLTRAIGEGSADFIAQLISGGNVNPHLHEYGNPIEKELWLEFEKEMNGSDVSNWMYQGENAKDRPADLGYYMGYKITEAYYNNAADKQQAVRDILEIKDINEFFKKSGYAKKFQ
ncbi:MAG TPA: DUF2268 domain-containing putative Zn-dependent protease [Pyrinomonadaceae bacterium]